MERHRKPRRNGLVGSLFRSPGAFEGACWAIAGAARHSAAIPVRARVVRETRDMKWSTPTRWGTMGYALPDTIREVRTLATPQPLPTLEPNLFGEADGLRSEE